MKPFFPAVIALVVGIVLGALQPRGELLALREELDTVRAKGAQPCRGGAADSIRSILRAAPQEMAERRNEEEDEPSPDDPSPDDVPATPDAQADGAPDAAAARSAAEVEDAMVTAMDARRAQALQALTEQGDLGDDEVAAVNAAMDQMNREIKAEVDAFVADAVQNGSIDRRDILDFGAEALDIVIAADDRMRAALPEDVYADVDDAAVDPFSYISGESLTALTRLEGIDTPFPR